MRRAFCFVLGAIAVRSGDMGTEKRCQKRGPYLDWPLLKGGKVKREVRFPAGIC